MWHVYVALCILSVLGKFVIVLIEYTGVGKCHELVCYSLFCSHSPFVVEIPSEG